MGTESEKAVGMLLEAVEMLEAARDELKAAKQEIDEYRSKYTWDVLNHGKSV